MFGKLVGKVLGEVVALPVTVVAESVKAAEVAIDQAAKAIDRAGDKIEGHK